MLTRHRHPDQCLPALGFVYCDGGREDYFQSSYIEDRPYDIQDCAVVAVSVAIFFNPEYMSPALSYDNALGALRQCNRRIKPWKLRNFREPQTAFIGRRLKQFFNERKADGIPRHQAPIFGTNTNTLSNCLRRRGFNLVFGEPCTRKELCLCSVPGIFVMDGYFSSGDDHAFAVIDQKIVADYDFRGYYGDFHAMHIWHRS